jgi:Bacterial Ig-like domain (group 3)/Abnormal spindle-like microcephaly-assoc'd, ASPM-SPD-2-Hydin
VAGNGASGGYQGEDGLATTAVLGESANNLMLDGAGNLYIAATTANRIVRVSSAQAPALSFGPVNVGSSAAQMLTLTNNGNLSLTLTALTLPVGFQQQSTGTGDCSATTILQAGQDCTLALLFHPTTLGATSGMVTVANNALNAASAQTISVAGIGALANNRFSVTGPSTPVTAGTAFPITVDALTLGGGGINAGYRGTVHVTSSDPRAVLPADYTFSTSDSGVHEFPGITLKTSGTQSVTFTDTTQSELQGSAYTTIAADAAASVTVSGMGAESTQVSTAFASRLSVKLIDAYQNPVPNTAVTFTAPATGASVVFTGGSAIATALSDVTGVAASPVLAANAISGSYTVTGATAGVAAAATFTLTNLASKVATSIVVSSPTPTGVVGQNLTLTATLNFSGGNTPSGTVSFYDGKTLLSAVAVTAQATAVYTTNALASGQHSITAVYSGDSNFLGATSAAMTLVVQNPPDFTLAATPTSLTLVRGEAGIYTITLTPVNGYNGSATMSCGSMPALVSCSFQPAALNSTGTSVQGLVTVTTGTQLADTGHHPHTPTTVWIAGLLAGLYLRRRGSRRWRSLVIIAFSFALTLGICGCGSQPTATAGTTQIVVTVADSTFNLSHTLDLTLTLK